MTSFCQDKRHGDTIVFYMIIRTDQDYANNVEPDQTPQNAASDLSLRCLPPIQQFLDTLKGSEMDNDSLMTSMVMRHNIYFIYGSLFQYYLCLIGDTIITMLHARQSDWKNSCVSMFWASSSRQQFLLS